CQLAGCQELPSVERTAQCYHAGFPGGHAMHTVLVLGAGKIGALIAGLLAQSAAYQVRLADRDAAAAAGVARAHALPNIEPLQLDATDAAGLAAQLREQRTQAIVSSLPYYCNPDVATVARECGAHYFDLT